MSIWLRAKLILMEAGLLLALVEAGLILALISKTHLRITTIMALNRAKLGKGLLITRTIQATLFAFLLFSLYSILKIRPWLLPAGLLNPTDLLLFAENSLQVSISGILLFLSLVIEKLHPLIIEGVSLEKNTEAEEKLLTERKNYHAAQLVEYEFMLKRLKATNRKLEFEFQTKMNEAEVVKARLLALKSKSEGFQVEYDRLLDYNQILKNQLHSIDQRLLQDNQEMGWTKLKKSNILAWGNVSTPNKSRDEEGGDNEVIATERCDQFLCSSSIGKSSPRHRRPIYQY